MSGPPECGGDAAAYALGALEPQEAEAFRAHMRQCAVCRDELDALGGVVQALPMGVPQYELPRGLRRGVLQQVRSGQRRRPALTPPRRLLAGVGAAAVAAAGVVAGVELSSGPAGRTIPAQVSHIAGSAELRVVSGHVELVVRHLPPAGRGQIYEVWLQRGTGAPIPASVLFAVNSSGGADVGIPTRIRGVSAVMVTREPLGGSSKPTQAPVIVARLA